MKLFSPPIISFIRLYKCSYLQLPTFLIYFNWIILLSATTFSIIKFDVWNPFSSCFGMLKILFTNKEYIIVQNSPNRVAFSKTSDTSNKSGQQYLDE